MDCQPSTRLTLLRILALQKLLGDGAICMASAVWEFCRYQIIPDIIVTRHTDLPAKTTGRTIAAGHGNELLLAYMDTEGGQNYTIGSTHVRLQGLIRLSSAYHLVDTICLESLEQKSEFRGSNRWDCWMAKTMCAVGDRICFYREPGSGVYSYVRKSGFMDFVNPGSLFPVRHTMLMRAWNNTAYAYEGKQHSLWRINPFNHDIKLAYKLAMSTPRRKEQHDPHILDFQEMCAVCDDAIVALDLYGQLYELPSMARIELIWTVKCPVTQSMRLLDISWSLTAEALVGIAQPEEVVLVMRLDLDLRKAFVVQAKSLAVVHERRRPQKANSTFSNVVCVGGCAYFCGRSADEIIEIAI
ncbi:hypothetical protein FOL47_005648 [Perkinsus chesapeaki]|uniref:Uncharacterized protein n=1 Tax=Perkinsus chesapeaki TaxID=330153 RepID=A0A7J6LWU5_PERCH|nr:hypothetical protein FOL47_005648 [Perkinsus chesapeaki]